MEVEGAHADRNVSWHNLESLVRRLVEVCEASYALEYVVDEV